MCRLYYAIRLRTSVQLNRWSFKLQALAYVAKVRLVEANNTSGTTRPVMTTAKSMNFRPCRTAIATRVVEPVVEAVTNWKRQRRKIAENRFSEEEFGNINSSMVDWLHKTMVGWTDRFLTGIKGVLEDQVDEDYEEEGITLNDIWEQNSWYKWVDFAGYGKTNYLHLG